MKPPPKLYTVREAAELLSCSPDHVYDLVSRGELEVVDIGHGRAKTRVPEDALAEYINKRRRRAR